VIVVMISVVMPLVVLYDYNFLVVPVPVAVMIVVTVFLDDNSFFGACRTSRNSGGSNAESNYSNYQIAHFVSSQDWM
jgi:hypothetical protein